MNNVQAMATDTLKEAREVIFRTRRRLYISTGLLAFIHLLIVTPYIDTTHRLQEIEPLMVHISDIIDEIEPQIQRLQKAEKTSSAQIEKLLKATTFQMREQFDNLREAIRKIQSVNPGEISGRPAESVRYSRSQTAILQIPQDQDRHAIDKPDLGRREVLKAIVNQEPGARVRLKDWAREHIVVATYASAQKKWETRIRPTYLRALDETAKGARQVAEKAGGVDPKIAEEMSKVAEALSSQRIIIADLDIAPSQTEAVPVSPDFWETVEGKQDYASEIEKTVAERLHQLTEVAETMPGPMRQALELQESLREKLLAQQKDLQRQFDGQSEQLAKFTGTTDFIPLNLSDFVALFPLVLGLVLGILMFRVAEARREAAEAAFNLDPQSTDEQQFSGWLIHRTFGAGEAQGALIRTTVLAASAITWMILTTFQINSTVEKMPIPGPLAATFGVLIILCAFALDFAAIRKLASEQRRLPYTTD